MAVAFDAASEAHTGTSGSASEASFTWNHAGHASNVKGVVVFVWTNADSGLISSVTYGGTTMTAVSGGEAADAAGEPGRCTAYFLGSSVPQGTQAVVVNRTNNATVMSAHAISVTANQDTKVNTSTIQLTTGDAAVAEVSVTDLPGQMTGVNSLRVSGGHFGHQTPPTAGANSTICNSIDVGATCFLTFRETNAGTGSRSVGGSNGTSDDRAIVSLAIMEAYSINVSRLTFTGQAAACLLSVGLAVGAMGITGYAPTLAVAGSVGIDVPAGAIAYTGYKPTQAFLGPTYGRVTYTGYAPTANTAAEQVIQTPVGAIAFTGQVQTVGATSTRDVPAGAVAFTGYAPTSAVEVSTTGRLVWQGLAPTVNASSNTEITLGAGSLNYAGLLQTVRQNDIIMPVPAGQLVFKGPARPAEVPQLQAGALAYTGRALESTIEVPGSQIGMTAGVVAFTGQALTRLVDHPLPIPAAGALALSGQYLSVAFKNPDCGSLVFQGLIPTVNQSGQTVRSMGVGSLVYTGLSNLTHLSVAVPAGSLVISTPAMDVSTSGTIALGAGSLRYSSTAPTIDWVCAIPAGTLAYTSQALRLTPTAEPGVGALRFTGYAPTLTGDRFVSLGVGRLVFTGRQLSIIRVEPVTGTIHGRGSRQRRVAGNAVYSTTISGKGSV